MNGRRPALIAVVAGLLGAETLHAAAFVSHRGEWVWAGVFFAVLCLAEWLTAWTLLAHPGGAGRPRLAIALSLATVAVWTLSRSVGMPFGPDQWSPEPVGWADSIASVLELGTALAAARLLRDPIPDGRGIDDIRLVNALAIAAVGTLTLFGLSAPETAHRQPPAAAEAVPRPPH